MIECRFAFYNSSLANSLPRPTADVATLKLQSLSTQFHMKIWSRTNTEAIKPAFYSWSFKILQNENSISVFPCPMTAHQQWPNWQMKVDNYRCEDRHVFHTWSTNQKGVTLRRCSLGKSRIFIECRQLVLSVSATTGEKISTTCRAHRSNHCPDISSSQKSTTN